MSYADFSVKSRLRDKNKLHDRDADLAGLNLVRKLSDIKLYSISEDTPLNAYVPLAPIVNGNPSMRAEEKREDAIMDFLPLPVTDGGRGIRLFRRIFMEHEYLRIKNTVYGKMILVCVKILKDTGIIIKMLVKMVMKIYRIPILLMKNKRINK